MSETPKRTFPFARLNVAFIPVVIGALLYFVGMGNIREMRSQKTGDNGLPFLAQTPPNNAAPAFQARALSGAPVRFPEDYHGKVVLVDFWATWCGPCVAEYPHLLEAYEKYHGQGFEILGVSLDQSRGVAETQVRNFLEKRNAAWNVVYHDVSPIAGEYRVSAIPSAFLIDGDTGAILAAGEQTRGKALLAAVDRAIKAK